MSTAPAGDAGAARSSEAVLTVSEERAVARLVRVPVERVRVSRRVVTRTVRVETEVEVRHEELVVTSEPLSADEVRELGTTAGRDEPEADREVVLVLRREVPVVGVEVEPLERVTVRTHRVDGTRRVEVDLAREVVDVDERPTT
ncbi:DUF2382 domain-containing protein [Pseudokineococcus basanitobsidens]|uniref:DUF2382 domain-containing protein n=1 Tax=Pseudokineococcus basanitobsidens TaxID=1926649 RepID=A0ABU8RPL3_9ACTN